MPNEAYAKRLKVEHGADVWPAATRPARLKADEKLRYGLIEGKRRARGYARLLEIEPCRKLDWRTREAPFSLSVLHQSFCNYSPRVGWSRGGNLGGGWCQGVADGGESVAAVAAAGFDN